MLLGACRLKKRILVLSVGLWVILNFASCSKGGAKNPPSGLKERVLASQGVTNSFRFGGLQMIDGFNDSLPRVSPLSGGNNPGLMVVSPTRNIAADFDAAQTKFFAEGALFDSIYQPQ